MRSTARWVLPVLVGPSTATRWDGAAPADFSLMPRNPAARTARLESRQGLPRIEYAPTAYASELRDKHRGQRCQRGGHAVGQGRPGGYEFEEPAVRRRQRARLPRADAGAERFLP